MARDFYINGESMVYVKSNLTSLIPSITELGLSDTSIRVRPQFRHRPIKVDAWGDAPPEVQMMLATMEVSISLVHFDSAVLDECLRLSLGGAATAGALPRAGTRLGGGVARFAAGNNYISLNIASPQASRPWRFYTAYMTGPPIEFPLGTERSVVTTNWTVIPYTTDPWNAGAGASNNGGLLFDRTLDN
jgi:hypothetical protein